MKKTTMTFVTALLVAATAGAEVKFLPANKDAGYAGLPDLALVESSAPLGRADRAALTVADLKKYSQEQLDQLYARLTSGPIPRGDYQGSVILAHPLMKVISGEALKKAELTGVTGFFAKLLLGGLCFKQDRAECMAEFLWNGKRFYDPNEYGEIQLRNAITTKLKSPLLLKKAGLGALVQPMSGFQAQKFNGEDKLMMFPANVYCGLSLYDTRRESIIIDYAHGDDFTPFIAPIDGLVGRNGAWIRDEIRMVRPGLYLGRAYLDRLFLVNFVLYNEETASKIGPDGEAKKSSIIDKLLGRSQKQVDVEAAWRSSCWESNSWQ